MQAEQQSALPSHAVFAAAQQAAAVPTLPAGSTEQTPATDMPQLGSSAHPAAQPSRAPSVTASASLTAACAAASPAPQQLQATAAGSAPAASPQALPAELQAGSAAAAAEAAALPSSSPAAVAMTTDASNSPQRMALSPAAAADEPVSPPFVSAVQRGLRAEPFPGAVSLTAVASPVSCLLPSQLHIPGCEWQCGLSALLHSAHSCCTAT